MGFLITLRRGKNSLFRGLSGPNGIHIPHYWIQDVYLTSSRQPKPAATQPARRAANQLTASKSDRKTHPEIMPLQWKVSSILNFKISPKCVSVVRNSLFVDPDYVGEKNWYSVSVRALNLPMPAKYTHVWKPIFSFMFCFEHIGACFWFFYPKLRAPPPLLGHCLINLN